ncbi:MAG: M48 family metallopeptidase [Bacteroides sp.]|nr:M48 family metallopeptidase [Bacteroides sp.]
MKKLFIALFALCLGCSFSASAQNWSKIGSGALKAAKALTLSDADMAAYCKQSVEWMDAHNPVLPDNNPYTQRLKRLTEGITDADGIPLNFKVYDVVDVNAFACPDGSVRVFSSLMDIMTDDELLGIIGHEIGHVVKRHSKNAFKHELMTGAVKDALAASNGTLAKLSDSQLGDLSASLIGAKYSQKQEKEADNCGYDFLVAHGKNPWGMVMAFEKFLNMESGAQSSYINKMFSSHPDTKSRIEAMTKRCNKDGFKRPAEK